MKRHAFLLLPFALYASAALAQTTSCSGQAVAVSGLKNGKALPDGTIAGFAKMNINIDGYGRAYHPTNAQAGALIHLCNAGEVFLPNGVSYHGSRDNPTCTGRFMQDFARIRAAGWNNPSVGAIRWYGVLGRGSARIGGRPVNAVTPVLQADGSGFYVSPTKLADSSVADEADQSRYPNPLRIPAAVIPSSGVLSAHGVVMGSFGVAIDSDRRIAVPFIVGDAGPRVGEGTPALARRVAGLPVSDQISRKNRYAGQVDEPRVLWVFFGRNAAPISYDRRDEQAAVHGAEEAFTRWGGMQRLAKCLR